VAAPQYLRRAQPAPPEEGPGAQSGAEGQADGKASDARATAMSECANRGPHPSDVTPEERFDVQEVTYTLFGLPVTFPLCADCRGWFAKFYREARAESNRRK
jgi:hypothetical protein